MIPVITDSDKHLTTEIIANFKYMPIKSEYSCLLEYFLTVIHVLFIYFCMGSFVYLVGCCCCFPTSCSEGIVANLGYLQSRRKTGIIYGSYAKAYFIQPTAFMKFFCRFIRFFYLGGVLDKQ